MTTFQSRYREYQCGSDGAAPLAKFENNRFTTQDPQLAAKLRKHSKFGKDFFEVDAPKVAKNVKKTGGDGGEKNDPPALKFCIKNKDGEILEGFKKEGKRKSSKPVSVWASEPTLVFGYADEKSASEAIAKMNLVGCTVVEMPEGFSAHEAPGGTDAAD